MSLDEAIKVLDDEGTRQTVANLNWREEFPYAPLTVFAVAHSGTHIYLDFFVRCNYLRAVNYTNNSDVYQDSCVEFFIAPEGRKPYYNFEFNCIGTMYASRRYDREHFELLSDEQLAKVRRQASCGTRPFEEVEGMFSWNIIVAIPLELIGVEFKGKPITLMGNIYKCADATSHPHFLSWAPIDTPHPDFHRPEFFAPITLEA